MRNKWTKDELIVVYYISKWGTYGAVPGLNGEELYKIIKHAPASVNHVAAKFRKLLGLSAGGEPESRLFNWNPSKLQREIVKELDNKTISQVRKLILIAIEDRKKQSNTNIPEVKESPLERPKPSLGDQFKLDL